MTNLNETLRPILASQLDAALRMLTECISLCPPQHWDAPIVKYPFWQVAYHTLCCADYYLSPNREYFERLLEERTAAAPDTILHPTGMAELMDEYPSRQMSQDELLAYTETCHTKVHEVLGGNPSTEQLDAPSGFPRLLFTRAELHIYNTRHVQHHAGQLAASLRIVGVDTAWAHAGWA